MNQDATTVLLTCLGYASEAAKAERLAHISSEEWQAVAELARQHGVTPLLYHHLKRLGLVVGERSEMPSARHFANSAAWLITNTEELKQAFLENAARNMRLYQELGKLLRRLWEQDIAVIALKGAHLAEAVYDNIGLRIMGDVDLLVRKDDLLRVEQELLAQGYKPDDCNRVIAQDNYNFPYTLPKSGLVVEIHWVLVASKLPFQVGMEGLWSRAQQVTLAQVPVLALSPADLLLYLCLHTAKHTYDMQLRMLCDIGEVVQRYGAGLDWQEIGVRAWQWGIIRAVYVILRLAQELLEVAVPADWLASLEPAGFDERYLVLARQQILADQHRMESPLLQSVATAKLWGLKGLGSKLVVIRERIFLSRETMALIYPAPANSWRIYLYYPLHLRDILVRHGATLWRLARGDPQTQAAAARTNQVTALRDWLMSE